MVGRDKMLLVEWKVQQPEAFTALPGLLQGVWR